MASTSSSSSSSSSTEWLSSSSSSSESVGNTSSSSSSTYLKSSSSSSGDEVCAYGDCVPNAEGHYYYNGIKNGQSSYRKMGLAGSYYIWYHTDNNWYITRVIKSLIRIYNAWISTAGFNGPYTPLYGTSFGTIYVSDECPISSHSSSSPSYSSSSSSSLSSSSSSSRDFISKDIEAVIITQNNHTLLPFTFISEKGRPEDLGYDAQLNFTIASNSSPYMVYNAIINRDNGAYTTTLEQTATTYVPQDERANYEHRATFYVDVIAKDTNGIKEVRTSVEPNMYQFEEVGEVFRIPKFTWDTLSNASSTTTTTTPLPALENIFWTASGNAFYACEYNRESVSTIYSSALESPVNNIVLSSNQMYLSTNNYLTRYINDVFSSYKEITRKNSVTNDDRAIISLCKNNTLWAVQAYNGKVIKLDPTTLISLYEYTGLDAPFKIKWSDYHSCYFVAGTYLLWKINDVAKTIENVYEINNYKITDFDVSEDGRICLVLNGVTNKGNSQSVLRILDNDLYTFMLNEMPQDTLRFCKYCNEGRFYAIGELSSQGTVYSSNHYLFNCTTKQLQVISSEQALASTTTTTTLSAATQPVIMKYPIGGEELQIGESYDIRWESNRSRIIV